MIMFFADVHLGYHLYHKLSENNITTSEEDSRHALNSLVIRSRQDDIDFSICAGDFFNKAHPSAENIRFAIDWLKQMDDSGKPLYILPGNHDVTTHFHSMVFSRSLYLSNIYLVDKDAATIKWGNWNIYFVPFMNPKSAHNKYSTTLEALGKVMTTIDPEADNIIVTHIQEAASTIGSENQLFAKAAEVVNLDNYQLFRNTLFLTGHMHAHQEYKKTTGIRVAYPGSLTYMEMTDCNQEKGFLTVAYDGTVNFEKIQGIRTFKRYRVPAEEEPMHFLKSLELLEHTVVFLDVLEDTQFDIKEVSSFLENNGCSLGKIVFSKKHVREATITPLEKSRNPNQLLEDHLAVKFADDKEFDCQNTVLPLGKEILLNEN